MTRLAARPEDEYLKSEAYVAPELSSLLYVIASVSMIFCLGALFIPFMTVPFGRWDILVITGCNVLAGTMIPLALYGERSARRHEAALREVSDASFDLAEARNTASRIAGYRSRIERQSTPG